MRSSFSTGGCDATLKAANDTDLLQNLKRETSYDYDNMVMPSRDPLWALLTCSVTLGFFYYGSIWWSEKDMHLNLFIAYLT